MKCDKCGKEAVIYQRYSGMHLCAAHEIADVERKVKKRMRQEKMVIPGDHVAVGMSGGKDSAATLSILAETFGKRPEIKFTAITIDEGIEGYRNFSIPKVKELCDRLGVPHVVVSFKDEVGCTLDDMLKRERKEASCTYCGVFRRMLLNKKAREIGANKLATGHNLDDDAQTVLLNVLNGDVERLARLRPSRIQEGLVPRIKPLMDIPEREIALYAFLKKLPFYLGECPYAHESLRGEVKDMLNDFESRHPGTKYSIMRGFDSIVDCLKEKYRQVPLERCEICGEPSIDKTCQGCKLKQRIHIKI
ncbi:TIGR00269 family protein [Methanocella conradii HZ254]|uniref:TIGR00269 family protein n=1 Tax=Methanocella conradii (strain DSM 24694 / JCM 17849 / CGMCC 1.5162 / HZ254) TaxID=1041930 RepID=H8I7B1_METCZ|nr:TIGR00269 family protein [Methanocella conradii]AFD00777.1 TIGR00269 family protein [Methanocella conradii HZ254]MDI6897945.1 TIGR00269 family protein [Methanocella conradii]